MTQPPPLIQTTGLVSIEYEVTKDDIAAFNFYHLRVSPTARRQYFRAWFVPAGIWLCICTGIWYLADSQKGTPLKTFQDLLPLFLGVPAYLLYYPYAYRRSIQRTIDGMTSEGKNRGLLGRHQVTLTSTGVTETTDASQSTTAWPAIERVAHSDSHAFIYINALAAVTVPKRAFPGAAEFNSFIQAATALREKAST